MPLALVRMALGAGRAQVVGLVVAQGGALVAAGIALGLLGAAAAGRIVESLLVGVTPGDPLTFAGIVRTAVSAPDWEIEAMPTVEAPGVSARALGMIVSSPPAAPYDS